MLKGKDLLEALKDRIILGDGAIGSELFTKGIPLTDCFDNINLENPHLVSEVHNSYLASGAELIETNTFGANRFKLKHYNLENKVKEINIRGAEIALNCAQNYAWVAGSIGPLGRIHENIYEQEKEYAFSEQAEFLIRGGIEIMILETFNSLSELLCVLKCVKKIDKNIIVIAQLSFTTSGKTIAGDEALYSFLKLEENGADIVGSNCSMGPSGHLSVIKNYGNKIGVPLAVFPNAGFPEQIDDRMIYNADSEYFAQILVKLVKEGANIVGGCCGITPKEIKAAKEAIKNLLSRIKTPVIIEQVTDEEKKLTYEKYKISTGILNEKLNKKKIISVELDPPKGLNYESVIEGAKVLKEADADLISIAENPLAVVRMCNITMATLIQREVDIETIVHISGRDRNLIGMQSTLMGMALDGIKNILAVTGDPPSKGGEDKVTGVFDLNSYEIIKLIKNLNEGINYYGENIKKRAAFTIGAAFNPNVLKIEAQVSRLKKKVDLGTEFIQTQPVFSIEKVDEIIAHTKDIDVPIFLGILPLISSRNAEFLHSEFPGIIIPDQIRKRMLDAGENGVNEGIEIAWEIIEYSLDYFAGIYIISPFNKYEIAVRLINRINKKLFNNYKIR